MIPTHPRIGIGVDTHRLVPGRPLVLGGVEIDHDRGLDGHSDADVLIHAIVDAMFGALAEGNIGTHFPNTDPRWAGCASSVFLTGAMERVRDRQFEVGNIDATIQAEHPKLMPHVDRIRAALAAATGGRLDTVSVKATTGEGAGAVGRGEVMTAHAVVLLVPAAASKEGA